MSCLIKLQGIEKAFTMGGNTIQVLRGIDFSFSQGEFVAIVGESGAGKTTLVDIIGLLSRPTKGKYELQGHDVSQYSDNELSQVRGTTIGFVFQSYFLLPRLSALQNVAMPLLYQDFTYDDAYAQAQTMLDKLGVGKLTNNRPSEMSGGQQQRVAVARALVSNPALVLADEPTGALDSKTTNELMDIFVELNQEGTSILMITHDLEISKRCTRRVRIHDGKIDES